MLKLFKNLKKTEWILLMKRPQKVRQNFEGK